MPWEHVDAGWGRCAPEFAYLFENLGYPLKAGHHMASTT